ncbi:hypothetical protein SJ05684_c10650 [Sinorhizobium sojae CCBAU 05684]|uniref:Uncharacterized protein n=1 Tax=Sinorhizobium sojae CCBAU 05684 TaxID=716928 RepID=A0A249P9U7_9HYPH|nr:hypothetical protein [Sinorhizobium sojae]ASY62522.1 hypothetical protein SJ05684_c10650 [Sinorhizobium sojae CCBAU 05684]
MWWIVPAALSFGAFFIAFSLCDGEPMRSEWGSLLIGFANFMLFAFATLVSLVAWLVYFIVN